MISEKLVERAIAAVKSPQELAYFFGKLPTPDWIEPLRKAGFFKPPPAIVHNGETYCVRWAPSSYLARMAATAPQLVTETFEYMETSDNPWIHWDIADAAVRMRAEYAARLAVMEANWISSQTFVSGILAHEYAKLVRKLAQEGRDDVALALFRVMFEPLPEPKVLSIGLRDARPRLESVWYDDVLRNLVPDLIAAESDRVMEVVCDLLDQVVSMEHRRNDVGSNVDLSEIWRPGIDEDNDRHGMVEALVSAVRDAAVQISLRSLGDRSRVVTALEDWQWYVFRRIAMHVICEGGEEARPLAEERILARENFDNTAFRHEYARLLRVFFGQLSVDKQNTLLGWIEEGYPHLADWAERVRAEKGCEPTDGERESVSEYWKFKWVHPFRESLPPTWKERYAKWLERFGVPKLAEHAVCFETRWGGVSPKTREELSRMSSIALASYLKAFEPSGRWDEPDIYGLAQELRAAVVIGAVRFSAEASAFQVEAPEYVVSILEGFDEALRAGTALHWDGVLDLCAWIVEQPREIYGREEKEYVLQDRPPGWMWVRSSVASLIERGLREDGAIPFALRDRVWTVLTPLTDDPNPPFDGSDEQEREGDPFTRSLNNTRGKAFHALVQYTRWVVRKLPRPNARELRLEHGLAEIPEAREVLEKHLVPDVDASPSIRSVYGCYLPFLAAIDPAWGSGIRGRVFPRDDKLWLPAWDGYILNNPVYGFASDLLAEYERAVERCHELKDDDGLLGEPWKRLAQHIMILFGRSTVTLSGDSLISKFFDRAPAGLQKSAVDFVGGSLSDKHLPAPEVIERFKALWAWLVERAEHVPTGSAQRRALEAFGSWFSSECFDRAWSIANLERAFGLAGRIDDSHDVLKCLVDYVAEFPTQTLHCLRAIIGSDVKGWTVSASTDAVGAILTKAMSASKKGLVDEAVEIVHSLGSKGFYTFRKLLQSEQLQKANPSG